MNTPPVDELSLASLVLLFFAGSIAGIITSLPIGPTNLWIAHAVLPPKKLLRNIIAFVFGLIFFDVFYAFLAFWGYSEWFRNSSYASWALFIAGAGLIVLGSLGMKSAFLANFEQEISDAQGPSLKLWGDFSSGLLLGANPSFIGYWVVVAGLVSEYSPPNAVDLGLYAVFAGIVVGDLLWYALFIATAKRYLTVVSPRLIRMSRFATATIFIALGVSVLWEWA